MLVNQSGIELSISADISVVYQFSARQTDENTIYVNWTFPQLYVT